MVYHKAEEGRLRVSPKFFLRREQKQCPAAPISQLMSSKRDRKIDPSRSNKAGLPLSIEKQFLSDILSYGGIGTKGEIGFKLSTLLNR